MVCPKCGSEMDDLTVECPHCAGMAQPSTLPPPAAFPPAPQPYAAAPRDALAGGYAAPRTSGMAIAALVCGLAGLCTCGLSALVGILLGIIATVQIREKPQELKGRGLAISSIIVSAVILVGVVSLGMKSFDAIRKSLSTREGKAVITVALQTKINQALIRFQVHTGVYPDTLTDLAAGSESQLKTKVPPHSYTGPYITAVPGFAKPLGDTDFPANPLVDQHDTVIEHHWIYDKTSGAVHSAVPTTGVSSKQ